MEISTLHEDDIEILDNILKICLENNIVRTQDLPAPDNSFWSNMNTEKESYYLRFFQIIEKLNIATLTSILESSHLELQIPETERFFNEGGFRNLYKIQRKSAETEIIIQEKSINEAVLFKWHKKTYWWTFAIAIAGFLIALIALILIIVKE